MPSEGIEPGRRKSEDEEEERPVSIAALRSRFENLASGNDKQNAVPGPSTVRRFQGVGSSSATPTNHSSPQSGAITPVLRTTVPSNAAPTPAEPKPEVTTSTSITPTDIQPKHNDEFVDAARPPPRPRPARPPSSTKPTITLSKPGSPAHSSSASPIEKRPDGQDQVPNPPALAGAIDDTPSSRPISPKPGRRAAPAPPPLKAVRKTGVQAVIGSSDDRASDLHPTADKGKSEDRSRSGSPIPVVPLPSDIASANKAPQVSAGAAIPIRPIPNRATKPQRQPSPVPRAFTRSPTRETSTDTTGSSCSSRSSSRSSSPKPRGLPAESPRPRPIPGNKPGSSSQKSFVDSARSLRSESTPPPLPSRSRTSTISRPDDLPSAPPPLPSRSVPIAASSNLLSASPQKGLVTDDLSSSPISSRQSTPTTDTWQPPPPPVRNARSATVSSSSLRQPSNPSSISKEELSSDDEEAPGRSPSTTLTPMAKRQLDEFPDTTHANRRAPKFTPDIHLLHPHHIHSFAVFGRYVCTGAHHVRVYDTLMSERPLFTVDLKDTGLDFRIKDPKVTAMCFRPANRTEDQGRYLICGTKDGHLWNLDIKTGKVTDSHQWTHNAAIHQIFRHKNWLITLDEMGKLHTYQVPLLDDDPSFIPPQLKTARVSDKITFSRLICGQLWTASIPSVRSTTNVSSSKGPGPMQGPTIRVYEPFAEGALPSCKTLHATEWTGAVTSGTTCPFNPSLVFLGHEGGFVSMWNAEDYTCVKVLKISTTDILSMEGVGARLWIGNRKGQIGVFDVTETPWQTTNIWEAHHESPVYHLIFDPWSIEHSGRFTVFSTTRDAVRAWDGLLSVEYIDKHMVRRQPDYCNFRDLNVLVCTWNIDSAKPTDLSGSNLFDEILDRVEEPDIIVFGFQEVIPLMDKKLTAKTLLFGGKKESGKTADNISAAYRQWTDKLTNVARNACHDRPYVLAQSESLVGLLTCMFIRADQREYMKDVSITTVKRGIGGMYGNKGAIMARLVIDDTSLCFINAHLAAGQSQRAARNADVAAIMEDKVVFPTAVSDELAFMHGGNGTGVMDHEMVIFNGDLNYRIDQRREVVMNSIQSQQLDYLYEHDQLAKEMRNNRAFRLRTLKESPITFAPTYKYDRGSDEYDSSEKKRIPAWCDRILYTPCDRLHPLSYRRYETMVSDHRPVTAGFTVTLKAIDKDRMRVVRKEIGEDWTKRESEMLEKMAKVFADLW